MIATAAVSPRKIKALIADEISAYDPTVEARKVSRTGSDANSLWYSRTLKEFENALIDPAPVEVQFSGGFVHQCWAVTRSDGPYRVIFIPAAGYFALAVDSVFGPVDIGVHGGAIEVFGSV